VCSVGAVGSPPLPFFAITTTEDFIVHSCWPAVPTLAKLCRSGAARFKASGQSPCSQEYKYRVATKPYKAPELLLHYKYYHYGVDMWGECSLVNNCTHRLRRCLPCSCGVTGLNAHRTCAYSRMHTTHAHAHACTHVSTLTCKPMFPNSGTCALFPQEWALCLRQSYSSTTRTSAFFLRLMRTLNSLLTWLGCWGQTGFWRMRTSTN